MKVLGVDPGMNIAGYGLIEVQGKKMSAGPFGCIKTSNRMRFSQRLTKIYNELSEVISNYKPEVVAVEGVFYSKNIKNAIRMGEARGLVILAATNYNLDVIEYSPKEVKKAVVGYGNAAKSQVKAMVQNILKLKSLPKEDDVADALAIAICHIHSKTGSCRLPTRGFKL